jgi:methylated-DNA-[protein]-cysteine S-methyltransferase
VTDATPSPTDRRVAADLASALGSTDPGDLSELRRRLTLDADRDGLLDLAYRTVESPVGDLLLVTSTVGLVRVAFDVEGHDQVLVGLAEKISPRILESSEHTDDVARELDEYFEGARRAFDLPIDLRLVHGFRRDVLVHLGDIDYGTTASYGQVAEATGRPRAARAVGTACAHNPVPIVLPCHRVVRSGGSLGNYLGNYLGGPEIKVALLELEGAI